MDHLGREVHPVDPVSGVEERLCDQPGPAPSIKQIGAGREVRESHQPSERNRIGLRGGALEACGLIVEGTR